VTKRLRAASAAVDVLRKKIVATKEGGMITGEERLRENLTDLYSNIVFFDGGPTQTQIERADAIARELADVQRDFDAWTTRELAGINAALRSKKLEPIAVITRQQWRPRGSRNSYRLLAIGFAAWVRTHVKVSVIARPFTVKRAVKVPVSRAPSRRRGAPGSAGATGRHTTRCIPAAVENTSGTGCHSGDTRGSPPRAAVAVGAQRAISAAFSP